MVVDVELLNSDYYRQVFLFLVQTSLVAAVRWERRLDWCFALVVPASLLIFHCPLFGTVALLLSLCRSRFPVPCLVLFPGRPFAELPIDPSYRLFVTAQLF